MSGNHSKYHRDFPKEEAQMSIEKQLDALLHRQETKAIHNNSSNKFSLTKYGNVNYIPNSVK